MNKLLAITSSLLAVGSLWGSSEESPSTILSDFSINAKVGFDTARVSEGRRLADQHFSPSLKIVVPVFDEDEFYFGLDSYLKLNSSKSNVSELAPYIGCAYDITDMITVDLGYIVRHGLKSSEVEDVGGQVFQLEDGDEDEDEDESDKNKQNQTPAQNQAAAQNTQTAAQNQTKKQGEDEDDDETDTISKKRTYHEVYLGFMVDAPVNPALYFSYDFTQRKANLEGSIHHTFDLGTFGANGFAIDLGAKVGYSHVKKPYGISRTTQVSFGEEEDDDEDEDEEPELEFGDPTNLFGKKDWFYVGLNADLVYSLSDNAKARAAVAFSHNNAAKDSWINDVNFKKHSVWFSSAIELSF
jgi:hypothetical protein